MMLGTITHIWMPSADELRLFSPELAIVGTILALLVVPMLGRRNAYVTAMVALLGTLVAMFLTAWVARQVADGAMTGLTPTLSSPMLIADNFTVFFKLLLLLLLALVLVLWLTGVDERSRHPGLQASGTVEFAVLLLTSALGMSLMVSSLNLLVILIAIEMASMPSYALVAGDKQSRISAEASLKYVVFGAVSSSIMMFGVSLLYGCFGTLDGSIMIRQLAEGTVTPGAVAPGAVAPGTVGWVALAVFSVGIMFKIAVVPFHLWCPDVFEGAPVEITTWLSIASKAAGLGLLMRLVSSIGSFAEFAGSMAPLAWAIGILAAITCTVGNLAAYRQESVKRMLAYSSIAHAGYMMMAAAVFIQPVGMDETNNGVAALISYLLVYLVMNFGAFGAVALVVWQQGSDRLQAFTGLGRRAPVLAVAMAICLVSLIGLPPLGGFVAKWWLLLTLAHAAGTQPWLWGLAGVLVVNTAISLYYYSRLLRQMYLADEPAECLSGTASRSSRGGRVLITACAIVLLLLGTVLIDPLRQRSIGMASNLFDVASTHVRTDQRLITLADEHLRSFP